MLFIISSSGFSDERLLRSQDSVSERRKSELAPLGVHLSGFTFLPKFAWLSEYKDNIFKTDDREVSDYIAHIQPGFALKSNWNRHAVNLSVDSDIAYYSQNDNEDFQDMRLRLNGRLDVLRDSTLEGGFFFSKNHGDRGSPDDSTGITPTESTVKGFQLGYKQKFNRFSTQIGMIAQHIDYSNKETSLGTTINQQDRNNWHYVPHLRLGYEIQPQYEAFVEMRYSELIYDEMFDDNGLQRSSHSYEGLIGVAFDITGLLTGDFAVGYKHREIDDFSLSDMGSVTGRLNLEWNPTPLMTVRGKFLHEFSETTQIGVSGVERITFGFNVEHELLRSLNLRLNADYKLAEYNGFDRTRFTEDRQDNGYVLGTGAKYLMSRYVTVDLSYRYDKRNVNRDGDDYGVNQVFLNLIGHL